MDAGGCGDFADRARIFMNIVRRVKRHCLTRSTRKKALPHAIPYKDFKSERWCGGVPMLVCKRTCWGWQKIGCFRASFYPKSEVYRRHSLQSCALHIKAWQRLSALYFEPRGKLRCGIFRKLAIREQGAEGWWGFGRGCARGSVVLARGSGLPFGRGGSGF